MLCIIITLSEAAISLQVEAADLDPGCDTDSEGSGALGIAGWVR